MTRADKILKRKLRATKRAARHNEKYQEKIRLIREVGHWIPLHLAKRGYISGSWPDDNSPTGYSQVCSYQGICQSPCNGDC